jgi:hypothetical protein
MELDGDTLARTADWQRSDNNAVADGFHSICLLS